MQKCCLTPACLLGILLDQLGSLDVSDSVICPHHELSFCCKIIMAPGLTRAFRKMMCTDPGRRGSGSGPSLTPALPLTWRLWASPSL